MTGAAFGLGPKQVNSVREATGAVNLWHGAIRSGKTIGSLIRWMLFLANAPTGGQLVMVGRTRDSVWRNVIAPLQDPVINGPAAALVLGNHGAPTVSILGRMSVRGAKLFGTTNPDNPAHWLKAKYLDRLPSLPHWRVWHFTMDDNPSLTAEYVQQRKLEFTGLWHKRFIEGLWVAAEGAVFPMWDPTRHVVPWESLPRMRRLLGVGVDYGTNNPTAGLLLGIGDAEQPDGSTRPRLHLVDEWRTPQGHMWTDQRLSEGLRTWVHENHLPTRQPLEPEWLFVDPSAASFKTQLQADGVGNVRDADNDVAYGIRTVASLLGAGDLVVSDRCAGFIAEAPGYSWDPKQVEKGLDKPMKTADHSLDGGRYVLTTTESVWRPLLAA